MFSVVGIEEYQIWDLKDIVQGQEPKRNPQKFDIARHHENSHAQTFMDMFFNPKP